MKAKGKMLKWLVIPGVFVFVISLGLVINAEHPSCGKCNRIVYPVEKIDAGGQSFHRRCFRCSQCGSTLTLNTFRIANGSLYCPNHVPKQDSKKKGSKKSGDERFKKKSKADKLGRTSKD